jgi:hypothetical protein
MLSKELPQLNVLFVSGHAEGLIAPRGFLPSGVHFLVKPFSRADLVAKIEFISNSGLPS